MTKFIDIVKKHIGPPIDLKNIVEDMGLELDMDATLDDQISGELERMANGEFRISANGEHSLKRKRFTVAHELGHYMLHAHLIGEGVDDNRAYRSDRAGNFHNRAIKRRHETEANRFAAQLLMPQKMVRKRATPGTSISSLAEIFEVSEEAMQIRLRTLKIGHDDQNVT